MDDTMIDGLEVEELEASEETFAPHVPGGHLRWQGQLRRTGSTEELPNAPRYRDYPVWLTTLARARVEEEAEA
jgi:hypothetical protein